MKAKLSHQFFDTFNLLLVCGSGGVGKTTTSAALALKAALAGYKTLVLTIDPAKRLATSLGIGAITQIPKRIDPELVGKNGDDFFLEAMMLDSKSTFDDLVRQYSPSKEVEQKILGNVVYQHLSQMIAGSQEYMAMEKLFEVVSQKKYDVIVIDTPPATHAMDFFEAPQKMIHALNNSMIHLLLKPAMLVGKSGFKFFEKGSQMILKIFDRITGFAFLQEISEMLIAFKELLAGFTERAEQVKDILQSKKTAFVLVAACEQSSINEAATFSGTLNDMGYSLEGIIVNRVFPDYKLSAKDESEAKEYLTGALGVKLAAKLDDVYQESVLIAQGALVLTRQLESSVTGIHFLIKVPLFKSDIHDLGGLLALLKLF